MRRISFFIDAESRSERIVERDKIPSMKNHSSSQSCDYKSLDPDSWNIGPYLSKVPTAGEGILLFGVSTKSKINNHFFAISVPGDVLFRSLDPYRITFKPPF
jgi:hypothetical protein